MAVQKEEEPLSGGAKKKESEVLLIADFGAKAADWSLSSSNSTLDDLLMDDVEHAQSSKNKPLQRIWIAAAGSRGDVQPYIAVGAALVRRGYQVTFFCPGPSFAAFASSYGMRGVCMGPSVQEQMKKNQVIMQAMASGESLLLFHAIARIGKRQASYERFRPFHDELQRQGGPPDLCLTMFLAKYIGWYLAVQYNVPFLSLGTLAPIHNPQHPLWGIPKLPFGLSKVLLRFIHGAMYEKERAMDDILQVGVLNRYTKEHYMETLFGDTQQRLPSLHLLSPVMADVLFPQDTTSRTSYHRFVGTTVLDSSRQLEEQSLETSFGGKATLQRLQAFLDAPGLSKPVYLGWGSMTCRSPEFMVEFCARAVQHAGQRAVVLGGFAGLTQELLEQQVLDEPELVEYARKNILFVAQAPHEWLFPRVACTVHHGGAGTTTAALRAGVPTIITPIFADQFDFAHVIRELQVGVGFSQQFQKISWRELGDAMRQVIASRDMARLAREIGQQLCAEDGATTAVQEIETYWRDYCQTGKFHELFPGCDSKKDNNKTSSTTLRWLLLAVVIAALVVLALAFASTLAFQEQPQPALMVVDELAIPVLSEAVE